MDAVPTRGLGAGPRPGRSPLAAAAAGLCLLLPAAGAPAQDGGAGATARACLAAPRVEAVAPCTAALETADPAEGALRLALERQLAWGLLATYRETDAIERFAAIAEAHAGELRAQLDLASVLVGLRVYDAAEAPLARALALDPGHLETNRLAALFYAIRGRHEAAHRAHRRLAERGVLTAMFDLAEDFAQGRGVEPDQTRARRWLESAAGGGHVLAMRTLAEKLRHGAFGTPAEPEKAAFWLGEAERASRR